MSGCTVFSVLIHNGSLNSFLCDYGVRALESHGYSSAVGQPPGHVSPRPQPKLVATRSQHSMHSLKKKKKKKKTEILENVIQQMFEVMQKVAEFTCNYVKGSKWSHSGVGKH